MLDVCWTEVCNSVSLLLQVNVRTDVSGLRVIRSLAAPANLTQMYLQFKKLAESPNAKNSTTKYANNYQACTNVWVWGPVGVHVHAHSKSTPTWTAINHSEMFIPGSWGCIQRTNIWVWSALNDIEKNNNSVSWGRRPLTTAQWVFFSTVLNRLIGRNYWRWLPGCRLCGTETISSYTRTQHAECSLWPMAEPLFRPFPGAGVFSLQAFPLTLSSIRTLA